MSITVDALFALLMCKQKEKEVLQDYTRRCKLVCTHINSHQGGDIVLKKFFKLMDDYDETNPSKVNKLTKLADGFRPSTFSYFGIDSFLLSLTPPLCMRLKSSA